MGDGLPKAYPTGVSPKGITASHSLPQPPTAAYAMQPTAPTMDTIMGFCPQIARPGRKRLGCGYGPLTATPIPWAYDSSSTILP